MFRYPQSQHVSPALNCPLKISTEFTPLPLHWEHRTAPVNQTWHNKTKISNCRYFLSFLSSSSYDVEGVWIRDIHFSYKYITTAYFNLTKHDTYVFWLDQHVFNTSLKFTLLLILFLCIEKFKASVQRQINLLSVKPPNTTLTYLKVMKNKTSWLTQIQKA